MDIPGAMIIVADEFSVADTVSVFVEFKFKADEIIVLSVEVFIASVSFGVEAAVTIVSMTEALLVVAPTVSVTDDCDAVEL